jgi:hypothetical protein
MGMECHSRNSNMLHGPLAATTASLGLPTIHVWLFLRPNHHTVLKPVMLPASSFRQGLQLKTLWH